MKFVLLLTAILVFNTAFSQWGYNGNPLTIKELKLTKIQQQKIKSINEDALAELKSTKNNKPGDVAATTKIEEINGGRIKKIKNILNEEQRITWQEKLNDTRPRRGVTGKPYERTVR